MEFVDDLEERGEDILSRKQSERRGRRPRQLNGQKKNIGRTHSNGSSGGTMFAFSDL